MSSPVSGQGVPQITRDEHNKDARGKRVVMRGQASDGKYYDVVVDTDGHLQVDILSGGAGGTEFDDGDAIDTTSQGTLLIGTTAIPGTARVVRVEDDGAVHVSDGGDSLTVDGTVTIQEPLSVDDNGGSLTVDGTVAVSSVGGTVTIQEPLSVDDNGGSLTVDGTVTASVSNAGITMLRDTDEVQFLTGLLAHTGVSTVDWVEVINNSGAEEIHEWHFYNTYDVPVEISYDTSAQARRDLLPPFSHKNVALRRMDLVETGDVWVRTLNAGPTKGFFYATGYY